jgi:hypothetical protein
MRPCLPFDASSYLVLLRGGFFYPDRPSRWGGAKDRLSSGWIRMQLEFSYWCSGATLGGRRWSSASCFSGGSRRSSLWRRGSSVSTAFTHPIMFEPVAFSRTALVVRERMEPAWLRTGLRDGFGSSSSFRSLRWIASGVALQPLLYVVRGLTPVSVATIDVRASSSLLEDLFRPRCNLSSFYSTSGHVPGLSRSGCACRLFVASEFQGPNRLSMISFRVCYGKL